MSVRWGQLEVVGDVPNARAGHTFCTVGQKHVLFGGVGRDAEGKPCCFNDVYVFEPLQDEPKIKVKKLTPAGVKPGPRNKHIAVAVGPNHMLVYGGVDHKTRYDDAFLLDLGRNTWTPAKFEGEAHPGCRSKASACSYHGKVYLFGGYGGSGRALGDLWALHLPADGDPSKGGLRWEELQASGKPPAPRFSHRLTAFPDGDGCNRLAISGGRDVSQTFTDMYMLDLDNIAWMDSPARVMHYPSELCNHQFSAVESVPHWKMFLFGGQRGPMNFSGGVQVMDCADLKWRSPDCEGAPPAGREDTAWFYDNRACQLVLFGGWSNQWLGDCWAMNVSPIIGPPYAALSVSPNIGPVFGSTEVTIKGLSFKPGKVRVKFGSGKMEETVEGAFVDAETLTCRTPNFESYGAYPVDLRASINDEGWTVNKLDFNYFANTAAHHCLAMGPGVGHVNVRHPLQAEEPFRPTVPAGFEVSFLIQAKDTLNQNRRSGGDRFHVSPVSVDGRVRGTARVVDLDNGTYEVFYSVPEPGAYRVEVCYVELAEEPADGGGDAPAQHAETPIRGSPFPVQAVDCFANPRVLGQPPAYAEGVAVAVLQQARRVVLCGGVAAVEVHSLLCEEGEWQWEAVHVDGDEAPPPRRNAQLAQFGRDTLVMTCGETPAARSGKELNDMWVLKHEEHGWAWVRPGKFDAEADHWHGSLGPNDSIAEGEEDEEGEGEAAAAEGEGAGEGEGEGDAAAAAEGEGEGSSTGGAAAGAAEGEADGDAEGEAAASASAAADASPAPAGEKSLDSVAALSAVKPLDPAVGRGGRKNHTLVAIDNNLVVNYGGEEGGEFAGTFQVMDIEGEAKGPMEVDRMPAPRRKAGAGYVPSDAGGAVVMFGGEAMLGDGSTVVLGELVVMRPGKDCANAAGRITKPRFTVAVDPATRGQAPCPRTSPLVTRLGTSGEKVVVAGGRDAEGKRLFDAYVLDLETMEWQTALQCSPSWLPDNAVLLVVRELLVVLGSPVASSRLSVAMSLDLVQSRQEWDLRGYVKRQLAERIGSVDSWVERQGMGLDMSLNAEALAESRDKQTKVAEALFEISAKRDMVELELDTLVALAGQMRRLKAPMPKEEKEVEDLVDRWAEVKKDAAGPVSKEFEPYRQRLADELRDRFKDFERGELRQFKRDFEASAVFVAGSLDSAYPQMQRVLRELVLLKKQCRDMQASAFVLNLPDLVEPAVATIRGMMGELRSIKACWDVTRMVQTQVAAWRDVVWGRVVVEEMEDGVKALEKELKSLDKSIRDSGAYKALQTDIKNFMVSVPLIGDLRSPAMRDRHWALLMEATQKQFVIDESFRLGDLLALELHKFEEDVGEIVDRAQKEEKMEMNLRKLEDLWAVAELDFQRFKETDVHMVKMKEEDFEALEENQVLVQGMMANRYMNTFRDAILGWNAKLMNVYDVNQLLTEIQRSWSHLESLFIHSEEVKKELPDTATRFAEIDRRVKEILREMHAVKNCVACCNKEGLMAQLENLQSELELCDKALSDYMESKRRAFPRFYFVSRNDLLDILSNGNNPVRVMRHMSKCFQAIERLTLDTETPEPGKRPRARGMVSCVGVEEVPFQSELALENKVESYMSDMVQKMRTELRAILSDSIKAYGVKKRHEWLFDWPSQLILVVSQIFWCQEVESALAKVASGDKDALRTYNAFQVEQLTRLIEVTRTNLSKPDRQKVMNMITIDAHSRDIVAKMVDEGCDRVDAFLWTIQLRSYWDQSVQDCRIRICDAFFPYGYEYLGNGPRLVITPLTDRIYITATQACWLSMGTAPAGPAGTGKTETTKDLSAQLGKSIYVFNCGPEMDYRTMGDIFKGLAASGSWGCFDEFNRLVPAVLSVCSVQYKAVCDSQRQKAALPGRGLEYIDKEGVKHAAVESWSFVAADGTTMPLEEGTSGFITMNPGYIGRAELPESLKVLFRPITVVVPDRQLIMENMLMAEGFVDAKMLAKKFAALYYLLEDLLSPQKHYDWGLRAIKSVLVVAGSLLRAQAGQVEQDVLYRALRDFNVPKILAQDMPIFMGLLQDLFPGVDPPRKRDADFERVIASVAKDMGLTPDDDFVLRVTQLADLLAIRHCVFLMGPTGTGRTECYRVLAKAITKGTDEPENDYLKMVNRKKVYIRDINPKSISTYELYGYVNMATREWKDGLLSKFMREFQDQPGDDPKWIMLDGDLDANWIESMNSVMDDNRLLTLPSNERIRVLPHMKLVFEIRDLKFATPATATRAGILYISEATQWSNMVRSWVDRVFKPFAAAAKFKDPEEQAKGMWNLFNRYLPDAIFEMKARYQHITPLNTMNFVTSVVNIMEGLLDPESVNPRSDPAIFETCLVFAMIWAFGGALCTKDGVDYRRNFDRWFKAKYAAVRFPGKGLVFDFYVDVKKGKLSGWPDLVETITFDSQRTPMGSVFVPTAETASQSFFLDMMIALRKPIMFVGGAGVGKTQLVMGKLGALDPETMMTLTLNFNYFTDVTVTQRIMESPLEKAGGINFAPPGQKRLVYFVDDMNMPKLDAYETAMPISLIRQHLGWGHWFDRSKLAQKNINNTQYVACMNPTAGSFIIDPRLQRLFMTLAMDFPSQESLMTIYGSFLKGHLQHFPPPVQELETKLLQAALQLHERVSATFRKTAINFHYEFTVRHLANVFQGLLMSDPDTFGSPNKFVKLWLHESERVYADRLVSQEHLAAYAKMVEGIAKKFDVDDINDFFKKENPKPLIFSHFAKGMGEAVYDAVASFDSLSKILTDALAEYNESNPVMDLVLFEDAMKHVCRISRIISNTGGHALLVGVGGSGKQSLARLAAFICGYATEMIVISGSYSLTNFRDDLQRMYRKSGVKGEGVSFLFTDSQIVDERMLVYLNDLLSSGEIPDLFAQEDKDEIINQMRSETKAMGLPDTNDNCWRTFIGRVRKNLHVCFTASPVGEAFRVRSQRFPATINSTVIDWFQPWPEKSLHSVAKKFIDEVELDTAEIRASVVDFMPYSFSEVNAMSKVFLERERRYNYTTPKSFLELIKLYKSILARKRNLQKEAIERLEVGLNKLNKTKAEVDVLIEEAKAKAMEVEQKVADANVFAEKVGVEKEKVNKENDAAQIEAEKCAAIQTDVSKKQAEAEVELAKAEPLLEAAMKALDTLNPKDLQVCKALKKPPTGVDDVTNVVLILLEGDPKIARDGWAMAQKLLFSIPAPKLIQRLVEFKDRIDRGEVSKRTVDACRPILELEWFNPEFDMAQKAAAAAGLRDWANAIIQYYDVVVQVDPLRNALAEANAELERANRTLTEVQAKVAELNAQVAELERQFDEANREKDAAIQEKERCDRKLGLANRLINALASEGERWERTVVDLKASYRVLVGDMLLASAFVSFAGPFTSQYRGKLVASWVAWMKDRKLPMTEGLSDPLKVLVDDALVASWVSQGLPSDPTSVQNGAILTNSERWPLMMDPQGIAWVKEKESQNNLQVVRMGQKRMLDQMERAIEAGHSVLIENMGESIDAVLNPVITRSTFKKGRSFYVKLGDKEVEYNKNFRLFLHTKLSNPHFPPEVQAETTLINFTVTEKGLEDQLLALVVNKERPELEATKTQLIVQNNEFTIRLKEIEDSLLFKLSTAEGDITEDVELIESLEESKRVADDINAKVDEARETEAIINDSREKYRPVAARGSMLFFLLNSLNKVHAFYQFSLNAFVTVFTRGIDRTTGGKDEEPKASAKARFMAIGRKVMTGKSFDWNRDLIAELSGSSRISSLSRMHSTLGRKAEEQETVQVDIESLKAKELDPETLAARLGALLRTCTYTVFEYTRRGLFDRDKLIVASMLAFKILLSEGAIAPEEYDALVEGRRSAQPAPITDELSHWMADAQWAGLEPLGSVPSMSSLARDMEKQSEAWRKWCDQEACEKAPMPGEWAKATEFRRLLILRVLRPDRVTNAMQRFVEGTLGNDYTNQPAFRAATVVEESAPSTPIFFILFPGYSPSRDIEEVAADYGMTRENGKLTILSMGQGQEEPAQDCLDKYIASGGWVFLDNVHLMQDWIPVLERKLEVAAESAHADFRCFFSAEPINGAPHAKIIPESILQGCIKISNEPPSDMKSNMRRAFAAFSPDDISRLTTPEKQDAFKSILFGLCFYHGVLLGRKKFGVGIGVGSGSGMGFCRSYSFNMGDLTTCADILRNYLEGNEGVPWADLRYMFGEIIYGGHIVDEMDRRTCMTYLEVLLRPEMRIPLEAGADGKRAPPDHFFAPGFRAPVPESYAYLQQYVEETLPDESPLMYGMHPNAQLSLLTAQGETLFKTIMEVSGSSGGRGGGGGGSGGGTEERVRRGVQELLETLPEPFNMVEIEARVKDRTPYVMVALQEAGRMNFLLSEMLQSLEELQLGLDGALNMSERMELLARGISTNTVPARWMGAMSTRIQEVYSLSTWVEDVRRRVDQLRAWTAGAVVTPHSVWLPGLFNPKAFITAVMQAYARAHKLPLDVMRFMTDVTAKTSAQVTEAAPEGCYVHGFVMEGARWDKESGAVADSHPNELHPTMPVILLRPVTADQYNLDGYYECPVYTNMQRANNYAPLVSVFTLRTNEAPSKWVLASVCLLMQDDLA